MGLLSNFAQSAGLLDPPPVNTPNPQLAALLASLTQGSGQGISVDNGAAPSPFYAPQQQTDQPPPLPDVPIEQPQVAPSQMPPIQPGAPQRQGIVSEIGGMLGGLLGGGNQAQAPHGGLLGAVSGLLNLPANVINAYASSYGNIPKQIAYENAKHDYALQNAGLNMRYIQGLMGGGGQQSQQPPRQAPQLPPGGVPALGGGTVPAGGGAPPTMAPVPPVAQGGGINILDPATQRNILIGSAIGNPAGKTMLDIGAAAANAREGLRPGAPVLNKVTGQIEQFAPTNEGTITVRDPNSPGGYRVVEIPGANQAAADRAYSTAAATVPLTNQNTIEEHKGPSGAPITATKQYFIDHPMAGQNPAEAAFAGDQAKDLSGVISADQGQRQPAMVARDNALRAVDIAQSTHFGPDAPGRQSAAKWLQAMGIKGDVADYADKTTAYEQIANQSLLQFAKSNLPSRYTERELQFTKTIFGQIKDPQIAALFSAGTQASIANKQIARAQFADSYDPSSGMTRKEYEAQWARTPEGASSIYADPVWQHIQIGGKPAVMPVTVRGHSALIVTPGLHPTVLKVN